MRAASPLRVLAVVLMLASFAPHTVRGQQLVDRILVRIEDDILTLSDLQELAAYQKLASGRADSDDRLTQELIEQWIVNTEATAAHFPQPPDSEISRSVEQLEKSFRSPEIYQARLRELGLAPEAVRRMVAREDYLSRYLDYKFRAAVQIDPAVVQTYYNDHLVPELKKNGAAVPPLESVQDQIVELLIVQEINRRSAGWLEESKGRLKIEIVPPDTK
ncbi:MAG: hypothetical protein ACLP1Y_09925 [Candidatus Acidiferrales bacterium]